MRKLGILMAAAAALLLPAALMPTSAGADGYRHHHHHRHHHHWGSGHWDVVRWANGDCKIWHDDGARPWGDGWKLVGYGNESWAEAWEEFLELKDDGDCR